MIRSAAALEQMYHHGCRPDLQSARLAELAVHVERHIVEELPEDAVAEAVVMQVHNLWVQVDGDVVLPCQRGCQGIPIWTLLDIHAYSMQAALLQHMAAGTHVQCPTLLFAAALFCF